MTAPDDTQDQENPACYCLTCLWHGHEDDLAQLGDFSGCPTCGSLDIVFTE